MTSINKSDNMAALALLGLEKSSKVMGKAMERLSSGKRINHASDDASGLSIATKMQAHTLGIKKSIQNANAGINILKTMDASLSDTQDILLRIRELAVKSASDNNTYLDRTFIQDEVNQLTQELNKVSQNTEFNNAKLLDGTLNKKITLGSDSVNTMIIDSQSTDSASIGAYKLNSVTKTLQLIVVRLHLPE